MIKKKGGNEIGNLTSDHKSLESRGQRSSNCSMLYIFGKIFLKAIRYCYCIFKKKLILEGYERPKFWDNNSSSFGTPTLESWGKLTFGCNPHRKAHSILSEGEWCLLPKVTSRVKLVLEVVPMKFVAPFPFNLH
jgi:hypothetical protein